MGNAIRHSLRAGAAAALGASALWALAAGPASGASAAPTPACTTAHLVLWLNTAEGGGAAGTSYHQLTFTNLGPACRLAGYPGVSAVDLAGHQVGRAAARDRGTSAHAVVLKRGASAVATLGIGTAANYPASTCRPVTAAGLRVYPPNQRASKVVPFPFSSCSRTGPTILTVRPVASQ
ncbi:MAG: hypothetical protein QOD86_139 [Miltoncostaeaceae bacterium]|jgi:hypothetical protein|nr:hypothetical protein [Miltoncostaeaceae bacterium]